PATVRRLWMVRLKSGLSASENMRRPRTPGTAAGAGGQGGMLNAMTVDLEDWGQAVLHPGHKITSRVAANLDRVLTLLDRVGVRATFFVLGSVCEAFPRLL